MVRPSFLSRFRRQDARDEEREPGEQRGQPQPVRRPLPPPGVLRRERRALTRAREERIRDLGGLMLEMYKRDQVREDLLVEQCGELVSLEQRLQEIDSLLAAAAAGRRQAPAARCECGAPVLWGSHFCSNCGRPVGQRPVVACSRCGHPLPADAGFCSSCGQPIEEERQDEVREAAAADRPAGDELGWEQPQGQQAERRPDPWEQ
jgi:Double zinc ribbon